MAGLGGRPIDSGGRLGDEFYRMDVLDAAPLLLGKRLCRVGTSGVVSGLITEVEAYRGEQDSACHARAGRTRRTEVMYLVGGHAYVYLCYGVHHLLNVVTGPADEPQAVLIRGIDWVCGPGRLTRALGVTTADNRLDLRRSDRLWIEDVGCQPGDVRALPRVGIPYATPADQALPWRHLWQPPKTASAPPPGTVGDALSD